ncbi:glycosyltransferase family 2 protein [Flavobacterium sp.]|uniref:glycosyltransferase family 2 protein n=1 Tax=Flavobacterium sp. TaxID=239 RepID=UPI003753100B
MQFTLIICTYMRANPLLRLLESIKLQTLYPSEILIIDGSTNDETFNILEENKFQNLIYYKVRPEDRGLTKQRNFGVKKVHQSSEVVCFLDDDTVLDFNYFKNIIETFLSIPNAIGLGGIAINENKWKLNTENFCTNSKYFVLDGFYVKESSRNYLRNVLALNSDQLPGIMPEFSHGKTFSYPMTNKNYPVDLLVGMSMSFRKQIFSHIFFSEYFEGYGLYEDADFSLRALQFGQNYIVSSALLSHYHDQSGRPNQYKYGKMVVRNGWYVWRVKYPNPTFYAKIKWHSITLLLTFIRISNIFTTQQAKGAFTESIGRLLGWFSLFFNKPK